MKIAVLGGGVIGLTTGIELSKRGHSVSIYYKVLPPNPGPAASAACALWYPLWTGDKSETPAGYAERITKWAIDSWGKFSELHQSEQNEYGIYRIKNFEMLWPSDEVAPYLREIDPKYRLITERDLPRGCAQRLEFFTFVIETPRYLRQLINVFEANGGKLVPREFVNRDDLCELEE